MEAVIIIDVGTSGIRAVVFDACGEILRISKRQNPPQYLSGDRVECSSENYVKNLIAVTREAVEFASGRYDIEAVGLTCHRSCILPVSGKIEPLHSIIMWQDKRAASVCQRLKPHEREIYAKTGTRLSPVFAGSKICWLREEMPELYNKSDKIIVVADYLLHTMTGALSTDCTYGSRSSLMDIKKLRWDAEMLKLFNVDAAKLAPISAQSAVAGRISADFSRRTGLREGTPVVSAGGDQQCGALGAGVLSFGDTQITSGTGSYIVTQSPEAVLDEQMRFICNVSAVPGMYVLEASNISSAAAYNWFFNEFYRRDNPDLEIKSSIDTEAAKSPPGSNGVIVLPYFQGRGTPDWNSRATGSFFGVTLSSTRGDFARAMLEGIVLENAGNLGAIQQRIGKKSRVTVSGGLTKSRLFNQIQADAYNCDIILCPTDESTATGAFISTCVAVGLAPSFESIIPNTRGEVISPICENAGTYADILQKREALYAALTERGLYP